MWVVSLVILGLEAAQSEKVPKNYCFYSVALMQIEYKVLCSELLDGLKCFLQHLLFCIPIHGYVIQVDDYKQRAAAQSTMRDTF